MTAISLFDDFSLNTTVNLLPKDGEVLLYNNIFSELESKQLMERLLKKHKDKKKNRKNLPKQKKLNNQKRTQPKLKRNQMNLNSKSRYQVKKKSYLFPSW